MQTASVPRETVTRLDALAALVRKWNGAVNLVAKSTLDNLESRHIDDSLQILRYAPSKPKHWLDIGSGGGFPGLVVAAYLATTAPDCRVTLIESDQRKSVFLREAVRIIGVNASVIAQRVESAPLQHADVISARALAPLHVLCGLTNRHLDPAGTAIFLKGQALQDELTEAAAKGWRFDATHHKSLTDSNGVILVLRNLTFEPTG